MLEETLQCRGIVLDRPADEVEKNAWTYGSNVFFRDGATQRVGGYSAYYTDNDYQPIFIYPVQRKASVQWIIVMRDRLTWTSGRIVRWDGSTEVVIGTYAYDVWPLDWQATDHNGVIIINDGGNTPQYWNETTDAMTDLPGWPAGTTCRSIRSFKNHLFALNLSAVTDSPYEYMWSSQSDPGGIPQTWTAAADNDAGNDQIPSPQGEIVDALELRDHLMICKDFSSHLVSFIGGNFVFAQRDLYISAGMINPRCAVEINGRAIIATQDDIIITDGNSMESIVTQKIRRHIFDRLDQDKLRYCQLVKRHIYDEVWFCYAVKEQNNFHEYCTEAAIYNTRTGEWGLRELLNARCLQHGLINQPDAEITWDTRTTAWDEDLTQWNEKFFSNAADIIMLASPEERPLGDDDNRGRLWVQDDGFQFPQWPSAFQAEVRREGVRLGDNPTQVTLVTEVWPHIIGTTGDIIYIQVGSAFSEDEPIKWSVKVPYTIGVSQPKVDILSAGRLMSFRFTSDVGRAWRMYNFRVRFEYRGRF